MNTLGFVSMGFAVVAVGLTFTGAASAQSSSYARDYPDLNVRNVPPSDKPLIRKIPQPDYSLEGGFGIVGYLDGAASIGPAWNVRFTAAFNQRFAGELSYMGSSSSVAQTDSSLVMTALDASARFNILLADQAFVQPFVAAGLGYAGFAGEGGDPFTVTVPVAAGVERLLTEHVKVGARFNVRPTFFDDIGTGPETQGADSWQVVGQVGGAF
ncbi:outer membrane beta-barrel protein [Chondromyces crocatus]|uniref:Uncharacterized protein n=1 Tax=Chondromyces crocatus TaxID=52 RepID=A0A0K1EDB0_CHOCO|nr:outer membrane beta-barrel protein [Chondromyces crocatus]AKT38667.1 uncharacterized protein CMC5_028150 [Chondromyces crocatus]